MKKIISVLLIALMLVPFAAMSSFAASDAYKATWSFKASVLDAAAKENDDKANFTKGGNTVYTSSNANIQVKPGQVVWVTIHLKTGSSYYADVLSSNIYYSNSIFRSASNYNSVIWNGKGKYTGVCETGANVYATMIDSYKAKGYPASWSDSKKKANEFYFVSSYRDLSVSTAPIANIDEDVVSFPIYVKSDAKAGATGEIFISQDDLRTAKNKTGKFYLSYFENGDYSKTIQYSDKISHDTSKAKLTFTVVSDGSQPSQGGTSFFAKVIDFFKMIIDFIVGLFK